MVQAIPVVLITVCLTPSPHPALSFPRTSWSTPPAASSQTSLHALVPLWGERFQRPRGLLPGAQLWWQGGKPFLVASQGLVTQFPFSLTCHLSYLSQSKRKAGQRRSHENWALPRPSLSHLLPMTLIKQNSPRSEAQVAQTLFPALLQLTG